MGTCSPEAGWGPELNLIPDVLKHFPSIKSMIPTLNPAFGTWDGGKFVLVVSRMRKNLILALILSRILSFLPWIFLMQHIGSLFSQREVPGTAWMRLGFGYPGLRIPQWEFQGVWCTLPPVQASSRPGFSSVLVSVAQMGIRRRKTIPGIRNTHNSHFCYPLLCWLFLGKALSKALALMRGLNFRGLDFGSTKHSQVCGFGC